LPRNLAGIMLLGNVPMDASGSPQEGVWFRHLPDFLQETAFIDRLHGFVPGWELPRITTQSPTKGIGFKADFFAEVLHALRDRGGFSEYVSAHLKITGTDDMRDRKVIERLVEGFLKLLFPNLQLSQAEFHNYCIEPAVALRQLIRNQLSGMDAEYKVVSIAGEPV